MFLNIKKRISKKCDIFRGEKRFDPLLILYVFPLTKKWSVYKFNRRFIWTVRDRITTNKSRKTHFRKSYTLICILTSHISIWSPIHQQHFWLPVSLIQGKSTLLKCPYYGLWKGHILVLGVPNNRLTCMQGKKHFHFLIRSIYFYFTCSTTPKAFV